MDNLDTRAACLLLGLWCVLQSSPGLAALQPPWVAGCRFLARKPRGAAAAAPGAAAPAASAPAPSGPPARRGGGGAAAPAAADGAAGAPADAPAAAAAAEGAGAGAAAAAPPAGAGKGGASDGAAAGRELAVADEAGGADAEDGAAGKRKHRRRGATPAARPERRAPGLDRVPGLNRAGAGIAAQGAVMRSAGGRAPTASLACCVAVGARTARQSVCTAPALQSSPTIRTARFHAEADPCIPHQPHAHSSGPRLCPAHTGQRRAKACHIRDHHSGRAAGAQRRAARRRGRGRRPSGARPRPRCSPARTWGGCR